MKLHSYPVVRVLNDLTMLVKRKRDISNQQLHPLKNCLFFEFQDTENQLLELIHRHKSFIVGDFPLVILIKTITSNK